MIILFLINSSRSGYHKSIQRLSQLITESTNAISLSSVLLHLRSTLPSLQQKLCVDSDFQHDCKFMKNMLIEQTRLGQLNSLCTAQSYLEKCFDFEQVQKDKGQTKCAICVVLLQVIQNYALFHKQSYQKIIDQSVCNNLEQAIRVPCKAFIHYIGPVVLKYLKESVPADSICLKMGVCNKKQCKLRNKDRYFDQKVQDNRSSIKPWKWLIELLVDKFGNGHLPIQDLDGDRFSDVSTFRGYNWRGKDCDQKGNHIYPGRKEGNHIIDHDCNGIYGTNLKGQAYQDIFCSKSIHLGIGVVGDSAGAHFSIPQRYMNVTMMEKGTFKDILPRLANQFDIPHQSAYTGYTKTTYPTHSIYKYMRNHNLCINNDYQNLGVNGGSSGNSQTNMDALARKPDIDHPMLMFFQLIGNDVCSSGLSHITKQEFKKNILKLWKQLDLKLPKGSHLWVFGLVDGRILYDNLFDKLHPLNFTYPIVYDFLNCLKISPCFGFLNSNQTNRNYTANLAALLNQGYKQLLQQGHNFTNFDIVYYQFPTFQIINRRINQGGNPVQLIQACDGFHPSGLYNSYLADWVWDKIKTSHSDWIGVQNSFNQQIRKIFKLDS